MTQAEILLAIVLGLVVNECSDVSPWCARRLMRLSARLRYAELERRRIRSDEWVALVDERPGKLLKLLTGTRFFVAALLASTRRAAGRRVRRIARTAATNRSPVGFAAATVITGSDVAELAHAAEQARVAIRGLDASAGAVVTVRGPWGSGKTSVVRIALDNLTEAKVVEFNPWRSWNEQPSFTAAAELPNCLRVAARRLRKVATAFERYLGHYAMESQQRWFARANMARPEHQIKRALRALPQPLIVVLDDIDRMPSEKIRELFNFVERTAHLPQLIYVMSFDRDRIEPIVADPHNSKTPRRLQQVAFDLTCTHRRRPPGAA